MIYGTFYVYRGHNNNLAARADGYIQGRVGITTTPPDGHIPETNIRYAYDIPTGLLIAWFSPNISIKKCFDLVYEYIESPSRYGVLERIFDASSSTHLKKFTEYCKMLDELYNDRGGMSYE